MKDKILFTLVCLTAAGTLTGCGAKQVLQSYGNTISVETQSQDTMLEGVIVVKMPHGKMVGYGTSLAQCEKMKFLRNGLYRNKQIMVYMMKK